MPGGVHRSGLLPQQLLDALGLPVRATREYWIKSEREALRGYRRYVS